VAGHHEGFLVGERDRLAAFQRCEGREQPHAPRYRDDHEVRLAGGREPCQRFLSDQEPVGYHPAVGDAACNGRERWPPAAELFQKRVRGLAGGEGDDLEALGVGGRDVEGLAAYRAGAAENRDALLQPVTCRPRQDRSMLPFPPPKDYLSDPASLRGRGAARWNPWRQAAA